jgi:predicted transposase YbfD/YdcC
MATMVLGQVDLKNKVVIADALHTVKATANHIRKHGAEFVLPVKENGACFDHDSRCRSEPDQTP